MKSVIISIDTEAGESGINHPDAFKIMVEGKVGDYVVGWTYIADILENYGVKGEFFVDVYSYRRLGEYKIANLCKQILERGHTLSLHTHPGSLYEEKKFLLNHYSPETQLAILDHGKEKILEWTGYEVKSHRAGWYGVDQHSLGLLKSLGFCFDSSYYYRHPNCKLQRKTVNMSFCEKGVTELPITVLRKAKVFKPFSLTKITYEKLDFRYGATVPYILDVIDQAPVNAVLMVFLHSFNFIKRPYYYRSERFGRITVDWGLIKQFQYLMSEIIRRSSWLSCVTTESMATIERTGDFIPFYNENLTPGGINYMIWNKIIRSLGGRANI